MRILIVEDDHDIANYISTHLRSESFMVDVSYDGEEGSFRGRTNDYDLIILDNMLPKKTGKQVCEEIRASRKAMPILTLSAVTQTETKIELLNAGADDYLTKPFSTQELMARVRALLRRPTIVREDICTVGDISLSSREHTVTKNSKIVHLTRKEFALLELLMHNIGIVLSRAMIIEHVWDINADLFSNTIEAHIASLRKKLDHTSKHITTVPGIGYKMLE